MASSGSFSPGTGCLRHLPRLALDKYILDQPNGRNPNTSWKQLHAAAAYLPVVDKRRGLSALNACIGHTFDNTVQSRAFWALTTKSSFMGQ